MKKITLALVTGVFLMIGCQEESLQDAMMKNQAFQAKTAADMIVVDFEEFQTGEIISQVTPGGCDGSISVFGTDPNFQGQNVAMIFDTANPTGGDTDLADDTLGKVLILSEDLDSEDPDDSWVSGSKFEFDFSGYGSGNVTLHGFDMKDLDGAGPEGEGTFVKLYASDNTLLFEMQLTPGEDGNLQFIDLNDTENVTYMVLEMNNSGAIDNLKFSCEPPEECAPCDGKVSELSLQYNGTSAVDVAVYQKKDEVLVFEGSVEPGEVFSFVGTDKHGTLGTEIIIFVDGSEHTRIHTSCSQPIGPGLVSGDFEVTDGSSRNGGALCPVEDEPPREEEACCDGKVTALTLQYNGDVAAQVSVVQKKDHLEVFAGELQPGEQFSFSGEDKKGTLGTEIIIYVDGQEHVKIHTSCSQPIGPGLIAGDFEVIEGQSRNGGDLCPIEEQPEEEEADENCCDGKVTELTLQYNGDAEAQVTVVQKKDHVEVFSETVQAGEQFSFSGADKKGTLGTEIIIYVDGEEHVKIHTSCSQPIGPGLLAGDFEVIEGQSRNGGALCPL